MVSDPPTVTLTPAEVAWGMDLAKWRVLCSLDRTDQHGASRPGAERVAIHVHGALAEVAVAVYLGKELPLSVNTFHRQPDLPPDIEVRWAARDDYCLTIREGDPGLRRYCLVTGYAPTFTLRGWLRREEVQAHWWRDYGGYGHAAWAVPQDQLHPMPPRGAVA